MKIYWFDELNSTQTYLKQKLRSSELQAPVAVVAKRQTAGVGSRGNSWIGMEGNLFFSFAISKDDLPDDLALESSSIYFSFLLKEILKEYGSKAWLKWPNDFYVNDEKIGGTITYMLNNNLLCGIGLNLQSSPDGFASLDIEIDKKDLLAKFFKSIDKRFSWKQVFSKYKIEFAFSKSYNTHVENNKISLENVELNDDGSLNIDGQRIYSLR